MRRLPTLERILLATLVPLWLVCLVLAVQTALRGDHIAHLTVLPPPSSDGYPTVAGFRPYMVGEPDVQAGDTLLRVGGIDLRGVSPLWFQLDVLAETQDRATVPVRSTSPTAGTCTATPPSPRTGRRHRATAGRSRSGAARARCSRSASSR